MPKLRRIEASALSSAGKPAETSSKPHYLQSDLVSTSRVHYLFLLVMHIYSLLWMSTPVSNLHFHVQNMQSSTVIMCLNQIFTLCGMPNYIHSDLGTLFLSRELKDYLTKRGIATSRTTLYQQIGNGQVERYNGIIWKAVRLALI
jgi:hypothetical protein